MKKAIITCVLGISFASLSFAQSTEQNIKEKESRESEKARIEYQKRVEKAKAEIEKAKIEQQRVVEQAKAEIEKARSSVIGERSNYWNGSEWIKKGSVYNSNISGYLYSGNQLPDSLYKPVYYKVPLKQGILELNFAPDSVMAYDGDEIVFKGRVMKREAEAEEGLVMIGSSGVADNTGLALYLTQKDNQVIVEGIEKMKDLDIRVMVPKNVKIKIHHNSAYQNRPIHLKNIEAELNATVQFNDVTLNNVQGPLTVNSMHGSVKASFSKPIDAPVSLISAYGQVDATIMASSNVDLNLRSSWGSIFVAEQLVNKIKKEVDPKDNKDKLRGKLNAGGNPFVVSSSWGRIYLRVK
jgi:hypothetical protein